MRHQEVFHQGRPADKKAGFTLIELSIVLVIIGLIVGGILVGQDLIKASEVRAQISQIEKYNSAVNTFRSKFNAIPGDMAVAIANQFGFTVDASCTGTAAGKMDGNGLLDSATGAGTLNQGTGETGLFWVQISSTIAGNLIEGQFPNSGGTAPICGNLPGGALSTTLGGTFVGDFFPPARIGHGSYVYAYNSSGYNWFGLSTVTAVTAAGSVTSSGALPVFQAYSIDKKVDDGLPTTGGVQSYYISGTTLTAATNAGTDSTTTCYNTSSNVYSVGSAANYGNGGNCALSFRFQ